MIIGTHYRHIESGRRVTLTGFTQVQDEGVWIGGVTYMPDDNPEFFTRPTTEFLKKFIRLAD